MKKLLGIVVLGLLWCNVSVAEVEPRHDVSLFGILLGDTIDNYKIYTKHFSHPSCKNVKPQFTHGDCYRPNIKKESYKKFHSQIQPPISNDEYEEYIVYAFFGSKKISGILAYSKKKWTKQELPLCKRRAEIIREIIAEKYVKKGWYKGGTWQHEMNKGIATFKINTWCSAENLTVMISEKDADEILKKDRELYMSLYDEKINTEGF